MSVLKPQKPQQQRIQVRGRPRLGTYKLETMLPAACLDELKRREEQTGIYRTRIAAQILCVELIGHIAGYVPPPQ